jgi:hypothetical protein
VQVRYLPGHSKANALFKGYKTIKEGYYELNGDYVGIGSIYTISADPWK